MMRFFSAKSKPKPDESPVKDKPSHIVSKEKHRVSKGKTTISTTAMFKRLKELKKAQDESDVIKEAHAKKAKEREEHPLSKKLSAAVDKNAEEVFRVYSAEMESVHSRLIVKLVETSEDAKAELDAQERARKVITRPLGEEIIDYNDGKGNVIASFTLEKRMKTFEKELQRLQSEITVLWKERDAVQEEILAVDKEMAELCDVEKVKIWVGKEKDMLERKVEVAIEEALEKAREDEEAMKERSNKKRKLLEAWAKA